MSESAWSAVEPAASYPAPVGSGIAGIEGVEVAEARPSRREPSGVKKRAGQAGNVVLNLLDRLVPLIRRLGSGLRVFAVSSFVAVAIIVVSVAVIEWPDTLDEAIAILIVGGLLVVPGVIVLLFAGALREVAALPGWLRSSPDYVRAHGTELARLVADAQRDVPIDGRGIAFEPGRPIHAPFGYRHRGKRSLGRDLVGSGKLLLHAHRDLPEYGAALRLMSIPFLLASAIGASLILAEWMLALVILPIAIAVRILG